MNACNSNSLDSVTIVSKNKNSEKGNDNTFPRKLPGKFSDHSTTKGSCQSEDDSFTASSVSSGSFSNSLTNESYPDFGFNVVKHGRSKSNLILILMRKLPPIIVLNVTSVITSIVYQEAIASPCVL